MGKKKNYESPSIRRTQVEAESGFCAASIIDSKNEEGIKTEGHEVGEKIDASGWGTPEDNYGWN